MWCISPLQRKKKRTTTPTSDRPPLSKSWSRGGAAHLPPQCSVAGTGWSQRGRGWLWWCGRSWPGLEPTGSPGSQTPAFPGPKPEEQKTDNTDKYYVVSSWRQRTKSTLVPSPWEPLQVKSGDFRKVNNDRFIYSIPAELHLSPLCLEGMKRLWELYRRA